MVFRQAHFHSNLVEIVDGTIFDFVLSPLKVDITYILNTHFKRTQAHAIRLLANTHNNNTNTNGLHGHKMRSHQFQIEY